MPDTISYADFERVDIRVGTIVEAAGLPGGAQAGDQAERSISGRRSGRSGPPPSSPCTIAPDQLIGRQVCAVVNFPPRQIGPFMSEVLTLGMPDEDGAVVLIKPDFKVPNGGRLF